MNIEALWTVRFGSAQTPDHELEGGVAVIESGRVLGGDSGYAYVGSVDVKNHKVSGRLRVIRHNPNVSSVYGLDENEFELAFEGVLLSNERMEGELRRSGYQAARFVFTRLAELP